MTAKRIHIWWTGTFRSPNSLVFIENDKEEPRPKQEEDSTSMTKSRAHKKENSSTLKISQPENQTYKREHGLPKSYNWRGSEKKKAMNRRAYQLTEDICLECRENY